jgi:ElaB/YqjD/DUF883 family membrane-anchored ribosome-binding protein
MSEERSHTNGAEKSQSGGTMFPAQLSQATRQIRGDAQTLVTHVSEAGGELQSYVTDAVRERPIGTLAVAAGIGFLLGGGLSSRLTAIAFGIGTRFAMAMAAREMGQWTLQSAGGSRRESRGSQGGGGSRSQQGQGGGASSRG